MIKTFRLTTATQSFLSQKAKVKSKNRPHFCLFSLFTFYFLLFCAAVVNGFAQEKPPAGAAPKSVKIPAVVEKKLSTGLTVAVVEKNATPIVTIQFLVRAGANMEPADKAGLANLTASMLTKGTNTRSATEIAEAIEFLGGSINSGAGWNSSFVSVTVTSDKVDQAMTILSDVVLNPKFDQKELDLLKSQTLDGLTYNLKQPSFLASYVASRYAFLEHPAGGTPASVTKISQSDIKRYYSGLFHPDSSVIIFAGDIAPAAAAAAAAKYFEPRANGGGVAALNTGYGGPDDDGIELEPMPPAKDHILVIDLPKSGQAAVTYARKLYSIGRTGDDYYPALVLNSVLGGGYSSRLNLEIRIKRGLSYGAGSSFAWHGKDSEFSTRVQTKNESAAQVAELTMDEVKRLSNSSVANDEMVPRKSVLTGGFGRNLETTGGLASSIGELYSFGIPPAELNAYVGRINSVSSENISGFATKNLMNGSIIIVGDYSIFKEDLAKRFPKMKIDVIKADDLDLSKDNLRK